VNLTHHLAQLRARLEKLISFPDLRQNGECLLGDRLAVRRTGPRADTCVLPAGSCKDGTDRCGEDAVAARPAEKLPCRSVTDTTADLVGVQQANGDINRNDVEIRSAVEDIGEAATFRITDPSGPLRLIFQHHALARPP
jgi:hypothetical protein